MRKKLSEAEFDDLRGKSFNVMCVVEMLCEFCQKPLGKKEHLLRKVQVSTREEYLNLLNRAAAHDRAEIDIENAIVYFYDHDLPGDVHPGCVERL